MASDPRLDAVLRVLIDGPRVNMSGGTTDEWEAVARAVLDAVDGSGAAGEEIIASFPLPAEWETVERMLNAVWQDGPDWRGANTVSGARWMLEARDGQLVVIDRPRTRG